MITQSYSAYTLPLKASSNIDRYKLFFLDIGLLQRSLGPPTALWKTEAANLVHSGAIAEQFVAQHIRDYKIQMPSSLYYWERNKPSSSAKLDFLLEAQGELYPIEVKAGKSGRLKSLQLFLQESTDCKTGYKFSLDNFSETQNIRSIPLYAIEQWLSRISY